MSTEESLTDLPTPNLLKKSILEVRKIILSLEDICHIFSEITNIFEPVRYEELKRISMQKLQETDSFIEGYNGLNQ